MSNNKLTKSSVTETELDPFDVLIEQAKAHFKSICEQYGPALFTTNVGDADEKKLDPIYLDYLNNLTKDQYQEHKCNCCHQFIRQYGNLVAINDSGKTISAMWALTDETPAIYRDSIAAMQKHVESSMVDGVFLTTNKVWGTPISRGINGGWTHFSVTPTINDQIYKVTNLSCYEAMALKREHYKSLSFALSQFKADVVNQALNILESNAVNHAEKVIGVVLWLKKIHEALNATKSKVAYKNVIWKFVSSAPAGFCTPRSEMAGMLMQDIAEGLPYEAIKNRFNAEMAPDKHMRPTTLSLGNVVQADKLVAKLGVKPSFERRFAKIEEIETIWKPTANTPKVKSKEQEQSLFGHLIPTKGNAAPEIKITDPTVITFEKFARTVLPKALKIDFYAANRAMTFMALTTAVHTDAPAILQWDHDDNRNPVAKYVYKNGSHPSRWELTPNTWVPVAAISKLPHQWGKYGEQHTNHGDGAIFVLEGAKDLNADGLALFPEILKSELHSIRSTIEQFSEKGTLQGVEDASACGIAITSAATASNLQLRVTTENGVALYSLDRLD